MDTLTRGEAQPPWENTILGPYIVHSLHDTASWGWANFYGPQRWVSHPHFSRADGSGQECGIWLRRPSFRPGFVILGKWQNIQATAWTVALTYGVPSRCWWYLLAIYLLFNINWVRRTKISLKSFWCLRGMGHKAPFRVSIYWATTWRWWRSAMVS